MNQSIEDLKSRTETLYQEMIALERTRGRSPMEAFSKMKPLLEELASIGTKEAEDFLEVLRGRPHTVLEFHMACSEALDNIRKLAMRSQERTGESPQTAEPTREILPGFGNRMIRIPGGRYEMGDTLGDSTYDDYYDQLPRHRVTLAGFLLSCYPVTVAEYRQFCDETHRQMPISPSEYRKSLEDKQCPLPPSWDWRDDDPIVNVSWSEAKEFCQWLSRKTGTEYRLPYEAEWEYAARNCGQSLRYPTGQTISGEQGNLGDASPGTTPVGSYAPNALGLYDMVGNVWQWCEDWYDGHYYSHSPRNNPKGPSTGTDRVTRGGCFGNNTVPMHCAYRGFVNPATSNIYMGFRIAAPCMQSREEEQQQRAEIQEEQESKQRAAAQRVTEQRAGAQRIAEIQNRRKSARQCVMCGRPLGLFQRILGKDRHRECTVFKE
jgi:sulfatase modifying factor 1